MLAKTKMVVMAVARTPKHLYTWFLIETSMHGMFSFAAGLLAVTLMGGTRPGIIASSFALPSNGALWHQVGRISQQACVHLVNPPKP